MTDPNVCCDGRTYPSVACFPVAIVNSLLVDIPLRSLTSEPEALCSCSGLDKKPSSLCSAAAGRI